jgi:hypothetical protein
MNTPPRIAAAPRRTTIGGFPVQQASKHDPQRRAVDVIPGALGGRSEDELLAMQQIVPALDRVRSESVAHPKIGHDNSDPGVIAEIEINLLGLDERLGDEAGVE